MAGRSRESLQEGREWIGRPSLRARKGQDALPVVREGPGGPLVGPGGVRRPTWRAGRGLESVLVGQAGSGNPPVGTGGVG